MTETLRLADGRSVEVHRHGGFDTTRPVLLWHHGSPSTGAVIGPIARLGDTVGLPVISLARPGYGLSTRVAGRDVVSVAADTVEILDLLGIDLVVPVGSSGGGPHALAVAARTPERTGAVVVMSSPAPFDGTEGWFAGMRSPGALRAAARGVRARRLFAETEVFDPEVFTAADHRALAGDWAELAADAAAGGESGGDGLVDDDVAFTRPWGFALDEVRARVVLGHGRGDRMVPVGHAERLVRSLPDVRPVITDGDGHVSVLSHLESALRIALGRAPA